jgi:hypothetical protein
MQFEKEPIKPKVKKTKRSAAAAAAAAAHRASEEWKTSLFCLSSL